jgi:hypothetical protein
MDFLALPLLRPTDTLEQAIRQMNLIDRRTVVVEIKPGAYRVFTNREVIDGWRDGLPTLGQLKGGQAVAPLSGHDEIEQMIWGEVDDPNFKRRDQAAAAMDLAQATYATLGPEVSVGRWISIVTRHEGLAEVSKSKTKVCACRSDNYTQDPAPEPAPFNCPLGNHPWRCA